MPASSRELFASKRRRGRWSGVVASWSPPPELTLSEWADEHFYLSAESAAEPGRWKTLPYQRGILDAITDPAVERVSVKKSARVGYALALDTPLPTPGGWTTMERVQVGDLLFDETGRQCRVLTKSEVFADHDCYAVRFCDGSEVVADGAHRWQVESDVSFEHLIAGTRGRTGRPKPGETRTFGGVIDTATMARATRTSNGRTAFAVRNAMPLELRRKNLPIPPYTLGLWLGDGHSDCARITQHRPDVETACYLVEEGVDASVRYMDKRYPNNATILMGELASDPRTRRWGKGSEWRKRLRVTGVLNNKHIPSMYLRASVQQRLSLLRGLMDSDGTIGRDGRAEFNNTNPNLVFGVYELVVSLGMKASLHRRPPGRASLLDQWRVNFKPTPDVNPFRLRRKAARVVPADKPTITKRRRVVSVERVSSVPVQCVEVDSPSHLFLAGSSMIPTHNTKCINAAIGYHIHQDPCPIMVVQPTVEDAEGYSKEEIAPMLRDCEVLAALIKEPTARTSAQTILHKKFPGGVLSMVGANSGRGFRRVSRRVVIFDEVDGYPASAGTEGDPIKLGERRAEYYWNRKIVAGSTPTTAGASRIEELYEAGDQRRFYVPCPQPHCGHMDFLRFNRRRDDEDVEAGHVMRWPSGPASACFECRKCGCAIEETSKGWMLDRGEWRAGKPFAGHASFHLWAAYSLSPNATWAQIVEEFLEANKRPETLKTFVNTVLGETWAERGEAPDWELLQQRAEDYPIGTVPDGAIVLTAGVDVQKDRLVYEVVGWAAHRESWSVDAGVLLGDTSIERGEPGSPWTKLDDLLARSFPGAAGGEHTISMLAVDSGYLTQVVYNWARQHPMSRVIAIKGGKGRMLVGAPSPVEVNARGRRLQRGYKVWPVGVDIAKTEFYGWLRLRRGPVTSPAPTGYCHFPKQHGDEFFRQITAEHLVTTTNRKTRRVKMEWQVQPNRENHYLDCRVYARAAAQVLGLDKLPSSAAPPPASSPPPAPVPAKPPTPLDSDMNQKTIQETEEPKSGGFWKRRGGGGWFGRRR